ncbi:hypothetical protein EI74_0529 [Mycoplasma testudineum]|uniref:Uncharacterized protein n=1 Tax=Mycoplasma testudineum TaxID=244584 RepID=A0A4R6ICB6_9MOLU|nr:hypothetical protein [Mycoplasma testudineum]OYD26754.1 hypothetical protein CG473_02250 [Mycoplasma testudineum]TDO19890.1 hypothetical protein EI74_0529 [Mycoplasma testudineum]
MTQLEIRNAYLYPVMIPYLIIVALVLAIFNMLYFLVIKRNNAANRQLLFPRNITIVVSKWWFINSTLFFNWGIGILYGFCTYLTYIFFINQNFGELSKSDIYFQLKLLSFGFAGASGFVALLFIINFVIAIVHYKKHKPLLKTILADSDLINKTVSFSKSKVTYGNIFISKRIFQFLKKYRLYLFKNEFLKMINAFFRIKPPTFQKKYLRMGTYIFWLNTTLLFINEEKAKKTLHYYVTELCKDLIRSESGIVD